MRVVFMGTPDFAVKSLDAVLKAGHEVKGVITQPDRPKGRGKKMLPPPVKERALQLGLPFYQPQSVKDEAFLALLKRLEAEVIVVAAYGRILPQSVLELPLFGCINVHGSLLPQYRGAAPIQRAILNGDKETGVTIMQMAAGMDTGDILLKKAVPIGENDTTGQLFERLAYLGGELLVDALEALAAGRLQREKQNEAEATYAPMLSKTDEIIDWQKPAYILHNQVRGLNPTPGAYTFFNGERLKIWETQVLDDNQNRPAGNVLKVDGEGLVISCQEGALKLLTVQPAGKKIMSFKDFVNGVTFDMSSRLGQ